MSKLLWLDLMPMFSGNVVNPGRVWADRVLDNPLHKNLREVNTLRIACKFRNIDRGRTSHALWVSQRSGPTEARLRSMRDGAIAAQALLLASPRRD